jgi:hypothetical protein
MPTDVELAYMAGIIDGEGCIGAVELQDKRPGRGPGVMFTVHVTMTDRQAIDLFKQFYGGCIRTRTGKRAHHRHVYCWQGYGEIGARLLRDVLPYLRIKGGQARAYLDARRTFTGGPRKGVQGVIQPSPIDVKHRFEFMRTIQSLNKRQQLCL